MVSAIVMLILLTGWECFADTTKLARIITEVTKGYSEFIDQVQQVGYYGIKHDDCFVEIDQQEVFCPEHNVLAAVKVQVEDNNGEVNIIIPEAVLGTVYSGSVPVNNNWRITIARHGDVCGPGTPDNLQLAQLPAVVTLYIACFPLVDKDKGNQNNNLFLRNA